MPETRDRIIAVIGSGQPSTKETSLATEVGRELARQGAILICGGLGGVMQAACHGACSEGGLTIGILPGDNGSTANPYVQIPIATGMGHARNVIIVKSARAVIAIGGSYGTLSEIAHALQNNIPVIGLNTWALAKNGKANDSIITAQTPAEAVKQALALTQEQGTA